MNKDNLSIESEKIDKIDKIVDLLYDINIDFEVKDNKINELENKLSRFNENKEFNLYYDYKKFNYYISSADKIEDIIQAGLDFIMEIIGGTSCYICFKKRDTWDIKSVALNSTFANGINYDNIDFISNEINKSEDQFIIPDLSSNEIDVFNKGSFVGIDLKRKDIYLGFIALYNENAGVIESNKIEFFKLICKQLEIYFENIYLLDKIDEVYITDKLTDLYNRIQLNRKIYSIDKKDIPRYSFIMIDIDNLGRVNDTYGHLFGDMVIVNLAKIIKTVETKYNIIGYRFEDDKFLIMCEDKKHTELMVIAEEIRIQFNDVKYKIEEVETDTTFSASFGISSFYVSCSVLDINLMIDAAYVGLNYCKKSGKNRCVLSDLDLFLYMKAKQEVDKNIFKAKRYASNFIISKVKLKQKREVTKNEYNNFLNKITNLFRKSDSIYFSYGGQFLLINQNTDNKEAIKLRITENLKYNKYIIEKMDVQIIDYTVDDIKNIFPFDENMETFES